MKNNNDILEQWYDIFKLSENRHSSKAQWHWKQLMISGLPNHKHEDWKYTPLDGLLSQNFILPEQCKLSIKQVSLFTLSIDAICLVFLNGFFQSSLSAINTEYFEVKHYLLSQYNLLPTHIQSEFFLHLTESLATNITYINVAQKKIATRPLYILHISSGQKSNMNFIQQRYHLCLEQNSQAEVIEHYVTLNATKHFTGTRFTFEVSDNAYLKHIKLGLEDSNSYHFAHNDIIINNNANVSSTTFLLGAGLTRHNTSIQLNGENSTLIINSLSLPMKNKIVDNRTYVEHNNKYCISRQKHKTIISNRGKAIFNGYIKVSKYAIKTDGHMINNNLLLSSLSEINTKPQLEIYADDVKCSHGITIGCISDKQIFYLRSRGIKQNVARIIIVNAFANELTENLENKKLSQIILQFINQRIPKS